MKKIICFNLVVFIFQIAGAARAKDLPATFRTPFHFDIGYAISKVAIGDFFDERGGDVLFTPLGHGGHVAFDWQGKGKLGFQIPITYYYHPYLHAHEVDLGGNLLIHLTKRDKALDPYFNLGLKVVTGHAEGMEDAWGILSVPAVNTGFGLRYYFKPNIGVFVEGNISNFIFVAWQFEGRVGVSFGF